jgi:uncharacterized membrane protein YeaQ/YmgE (transglycosylase-associated protein family)
VAGRAPESLNHSPHTGRALKTYAPGVEIGSMTLAITILIGVAVGAMVELLLPGHTPAELVLAMLLGTAGALLGRVFGERTGLYGTDEPMAIIAAVIGAIVVLGIWGVAFRRGKNIRRH